MLLVTLLVLGGVASVGDTRARSRELDGLLAQVEQGEGAVTYADRKVAAMVTYASPALWSASTAPGTRADLERIVEEAAAEGSVRLRGLAAEVAGIRVLPWHGDVADARDRYAAYLAGRAAYLERVAADAGALFDGDPDRGAGLADVRAAVLPLVDASGRDRIDELIPPR